MIHAFLNWHILHYFHSSEREEEEEEERLCDWRNDRGTDWVGMTMKFSKKKWREIKTACSLLQKCKQIEQYGGDVFW